MTHFFTEQVRRDPYPLFAQFRSASPLLHEPASGLWLVFDYPTVKRVLSDPQTFSSRLGPDWLIFHDPPRHTRMRALISAAFTPGSVAALEPRIRQLCRALLQPAAERGEMDFAEEFSVPLPIMVIAQMLGLPPGDHAKFKGWTDVILRMSYTIGTDGETAQAAARDFQAVTLEMRAYLAEALAERTRAARDDLLTRLLRAEIDGQRLTQDEILGFFQLLLLAGSETTADLLNNAMLCFMENPEQLARLRSVPGLLPSAIEEVLRFRSPLQWMYRVTRQEVELHGQAIPAGKVVLALIGSANRDPQHFPDPDRFDITREPNPHLAFGHAGHFCLGASLARLAARVALEEALQHMHNFERVSQEPWQPRPGLHVLGPAHLRLRFQASARLTTAS